MQREYRMPKKYSKPRKYNGKCEKCGVVTKDIYQEIDESNISITYYAPYLCKKCYDNLHNRVGEINK